MDIYVTALALGGVGLGAMALSGLGRPGHGSHGGDGAHAGDAHGNGHFGSSHVGHDVSHGHVGHHGHAGHHGHEGHHSHDAHPVHHGQGAHASHANPLLALMSPRLLFSVALGLGTAGLLLRGTLGEPILFLAALTVGVLFDRLIVAPLWNFTFRFASTPAVTLESALMDEATAVTTFDRNGQGLIAMQVDGQMVQLLGTLQTRDREMNIKVPVGARLRIEDVDAARNRCTVSLI